METGVCLHYQYTNPDTGAPEEIATENVETRSQPESRKNVPCLLHSQFYGRKLEHRRAAQNEVGANKKRIEWDSRICSYVFDDHRVRDHRTGYQTFDVNGVMGGNIDAPIKVYLIQVGAGATNG